MTDPAAPHRPADPAPPTFPFSAVVGAADAKLALVLAALDPRIGGVLLRGDKGSAKSTLARGLAGLLPAGDAATGDLSGAGAFVELPLGATEERVVGSLDLAAALGTGEVRFQPGLLAAAHGGVLYVDEVNLLADHLVDVLLDVATSGVNRVERDGVSRAHPARFVLVGTMNPEEGDLRPQLLDRFGLAVDVRAEAEPAARVEAVRRRLDFDADPAAFVARPAVADEEAELRARLAACTPAALTDDLLAAAVAVCVAAGAEGLRADLTLARAAAAHAGWLGRPEATTDDVRAVAHLVLAHRARRHPLDPPGASPDALADALDDALGPRPDPPSSADPSAGPGHQPDEPDAETDRHGPPDGGADGWGGEPTDAADDPGGRTPDAGGTTGPTSGHRPGRPATGAAGRPPSGSDGRDGRDPSTPPAPTRTVAAEDPAAVVALRVGALAPGEGSGRRSPVVGTRGRTVGSRVPEGAPSSIAVVPSLTASAARRAGDATAEAGITAADVREPVRVAQAGNLLVLAVDASGSMGASDRMAAVKGALLGLLVDAYQRRDRVALVTFGGSGAHVVLRPTGSVEVARARLEELPTGGDTPLAEGLAVATDLATTGATPTSRPLLVVVTDGRGTAGADPWAAALRSAEAVARRRLPAVVVDVEVPGPGALGLAAPLAAAMGARHLPLPQLTAGRLESTLRGLS